MDLLQLSQLLLRNYGIVLSVVIDIFII